MGKQIKVVGAVMVRDGRVLCAQRGPLGSLPGRWEFPGGKIQPGGTARHALEREIAEELGCRVDVGAELTTTTHVYDFGEVTLTTYWCTLKSGALQLREHADVRWLPTRELESLDWAPADIPAVRMIVTQGAPG